MPIIDTHCHAGHNWFEPIEVLEFQMNQNGVDGAVLIQHGGTYDNNYLIDEAAKRPGRFKVAVMIDPDDHDPLGTLEKLAGQGAAGIRLNYDHRFSAVDTLAVWKKAVELGLVITTNGKSAEFGGTEFKKRLDACSEGQVVIEHLAGANTASQPPYTDFKAALECAKWPNTTIKVPGLGEITRRPPRLLPEFKFDNIPPLFEMARDAFGAQRMMWGSDFPPSAGREGYANTLAAIKQSPAFSNGDDRDWVLGKTAARVWGFENLDG